MQYAWARDAALSGQPRLSPCLVSYCIYRPRRRRGPWRGVARCGCTHTCLTSLACSACEVWASALVSSPPSKIHARDAVGSPANCITLCMQKCNKFITCYKLIMWSAVFSHNIYLRARCYSGRAPVGSTRSGSACDHLRYSCCPGARRRTCWRYLRLG